MKRGATLQPTLAAAAAGRALAASPAQFGAQLKPFWDRSRQYILEFLEKMSEEHYGFKPTPAISSFAEQMSHLGNGSFLLAGAIKGEKKAPMKPPKELTRANLARFVAASYDYAGAVPSGLTDAAAGETVDFLSEKLTRRHLALRLFDHATHHRGQTVIYLRLKGIVPPEYRQ